MEPGNEANLAVHLQYHVNTLPFQTLLISNNIILFSREYHTEHYYMVWTLLGCIMHMTFLKAWALGHCYYMYILQDTTEKKIVHMNIGVSNNNIIIIYMCKRVLRFSGAY